ncbi:MAG: hypothetical protein K9N23_08685, partial [Akkermansiaceae bacterium]|nr:hypothetical protein [Akkermansiaceae bacterium]
PAQYCQFKPWSACLATCSKMAAETLRTAGDTEFLDIYSGFSGTQRFSGLSVSNHQKFWKFGLS